ncbi:MAG: hypothetical protein A2096_13765 [Spirochaetes bacterium GWF1_41_5]|nr:MAG: hypothetical protein A2096_13765 [Spirochaetes bacterium GWF1_41_5]HBE01724.1 hypothetical protein [Spirochaetia bacterium]
MIFRVAVISRARYEKKLFFSHTLFPLIYWKNKIAGCGIKIFFYNNLSTAADADAALLVDYFLQSEITDGTVCAVLKSVRKKFNRVYYFDTTDSCGTADFEIIPYVDKYFKKQLYRDRSLYFRPVYGLRTFCEYYYEKFGIKNSLEETRAPLKFEYADRLSLAWNIGLADYTGSCRLLNTANRFLGMPVKKYFQVFNNMHPVRPFKSRTVDIQARFGMNYILECIGWSRKKMQDIALKMENRFIVRSRGRINKKKFIQELADTKTALSPFGYGEICFRDFEIFLNGALLIKPDMSHLETWPDYYLPGITYLPCNWNFSNLQEILENALARDISNTAVEGRNRFLAALTDQGGEKFAERFIGLVRD